MSATKREQGAIRRMKEIQTSAAESRFIKSYIAPCGMGYKEIKPEDCGALTDAPIITDGKNVWGFMRYQVESLLVELAAGREIEWQRG